MKFFKIRFPLYFCFNNTARKKKIKKNLASGLTFNSGCSAQMKIFAFIGVGSFFKRHFERCTMIPKRCRYHFALKIEKKNGKSNLRHTIFHLKVLFSPNEYYCTLISRNIFQRAVNFWLFLTVLFQNQDIYSHLKNIS